MWNLSLYIVTWNVSNKYPDNIKLNELLDIDHHFTEKRLPDFYIIGLQEINANPQNVVSSLFKNDPWVQKLKDLLKPLGYVLLKSEQMQGLLMAIFIQKKHFYHIREIESEYTRTGFGGMWGNKGAVAIRMNCYGCSICLVNSHLAAHDEMLEERINDYQRIKDATHFSVKVSKRIHEHDYVFWFGDLNFRLFNTADSQKNYTPEEISEMVKKDKLSELIKNDQLSTIMCEGRAFSELVERLPQFPPTFKFVPDSDVYDMKRRPAWCDRILYKAKNKILKSCTLHLEQLSYKSHPNYKISDHKPVTSEFKITAPEDDVTNLIVKFKPLGIWNNSEENFVEFTLPPNYVSGSADWIGIYSENFTGFDEYYGWEYTETGSDRPEDFKRVLQINFPESINLPLDGSFIFLYFQSTGTRGYTSMLGMSDPFTVIKRCPSPRPDTID